MPEFAGWLQKVEDFGNPNGKVATNETNPKIFRPHCKVCDKFLACGKSELQKHGQTEVHKVKLEAYNQVDTERKVLETFVNQGLAKQAFMLELRLCCLIAHHNVPFSFVDELIPVLKKGLPNDPVVQKMALGKQKASNLIREGMCLWINLIYLYLLINCF